MAALSVLAPYPIFNDRDGQPIDNGRIYIGTVNLDPVANPIQVYWDEALTIPASQPIYTLGGYPVYQGTPSTIYVNADDFSITVKNDQGLLIYTALQTSLKITVNQITDLNADAVDYDPPFTGAVTSNYTVEDKLAQIVSVLDAGAVGDGVTDDTAVINTALANNLCVSFPQAPNTSTPTRYGYSGSGIIITQSGSQLVFDAGVTMVPLGGTKPTCISATGAGPSVWYNLNADAQEGGITFELATLPTGWAVGDWVEIVDTTNISGCPNTQNNKQACIRRIEKISGTAPVTIYVHKALPYTFTTVATAKAGKATMIENIVIQRPTINEEDYGTTLMGFGIRLQYVARCQIIDATGYGSKLPYAASSSAFSFIQLSNCVDVDVINPRGEHIEWYGVEAIGATEDIRITGGQMIDSRHGVSINWMTSGDKYGMPINVLVDGMRSLEAELSGFDTHDTGRQIVFKNCLSDSSGDYGYQARTTNIVYDTCRAIGSRIDGFFQDTNATGLIAVNCEAFHNGRNGVRWDYGKTTWIGGKIRYNGSAYNVSGSPTAGGGPGFRTGGGIIKEATFAGNNSCVSISANGVDVLVEGCYAPADADQVAFLYTTSAAINLGNVRLANNYIPGYGDLLFNNFSAKTDIIPLSYGNVTTDTASQRSGFVTLVAGSATVANAAYRDYAGAGGKEPQYSKITLTRTASGGTLGALYIEPNGDGVGFFIKSTSALDTSTVRWEMSI